MHLLQKIDELVLLLQVPLPAQHRCIRCGAGPGAEQLAVGSADELLPVFGGAAVHALLAGGWLGIALELGLLALQALHRKPGREAGARRALGAFPKPSLRACTAVIAVKDRGRTSQAQAAFEPSHATATFRLRMRH